ncbi:MAG: DUF2336 domain-containing protein [Sphingomonas sp.]|uniref:DUF2336 domain-containing protein n=1 Tax=Sphingomonas sp. TaxID=28214 RepID=UPI001AD1C9A5|nr:DUF2336 domain-containing protein [Sphingomonas sp.]MBN8807214.1 DUF2336 domain-containing protein [Sphingomonas sp.]
MSIERDIGDGVESASPLLARATAAATHGAHRLAGSIDDFFTPDDARLDERTRTLAARSLAAMVGLVERDVRRQAARAFGDGGPGTRVAEGAPVLDRLIAAGVVRDPALMHELLTRVRLDLLGDGLTDAATDERGAASLLTRLAASGDAAVAQAAMAVMASAARRRGFLDGNRLDTTELPAELHHRLVWWIAAAIREQLGDSGADRALTDAALRHLAQYDESDRLEAAAERLVVAIDAKPAELPVLLVHAIGGRHVVLFAALLGAALRIDLSTMREIVSERDAALWLALRAAELDRTTVARIGLALAPDAETFADQLDEIMAVDPAAARQALARYALHPDLRAALTAIEAAR